MRVTVTSPTGIAIAVDLANPWAASPGVDFAASYVSETAGQRAHVDIYTEATAPAIALDPAQPTVPSGVWLVNVSHVAGGQFDCDAYVQRDDTLAGRIAMGRQSYSTIQYAHRAARDHQETKRTPEFDGRRQSAT